MSPASRLFAAVVCLCATSSFAATPATPAAPPTATRPAAAAPLGAAKAYPDPSRFEKAIRAFEAKDATATPAPGGIVCVGSSSMAGWHGTIVKDLAPLPVIPRGFGGSNMNDALHYIDRVVLRYRPRAVVLYEGDNDIGQGIAPEKIRDTFVAFAKKLHAALPETRLYVISIKPSMKRWPLWSRIVEANKLIREACAKDARLQYVSIVEPMLLADGTPNTALFKADKLHMLPAGYAIWRDTLKPILMQREGLAATAAVAPITAPAAATAIATPAAATPAEKK